MKYTALLFFALLFGCRNDPTVKPPEFIPEAPDSLRFCMQIETRQASERRAVGIPPSYWPQNKVLKVGFLNSPAQVQIAFFKDCAATWDSILNLSFTYPEQGPYDLRVGFDISQGSYSYIGADAVYVPQSQRTINIGWGWNSTKIVSGKTIYTDGVIRHELGHAIGAGHEQCNPNNPLCWNKEQVYADLAKPPNGWSRAMVDANVFKICTGSQNTPRDNASIMMYSIPLSWLGCGATAAIQGSNYLSSVDRSFWASVYPGAVIPPDPPTGITLTSAQIQSLMANATNTRDLANAAATKAAEALSAANVAKVSATNNYVALKAALGQ